MRTILVVAAMLIVAPVTARAGGGSHIIDPDRLDRPCRALVEMPADAQTMRPAVAAAISAASCMATERLRAVSPTADEDGVAALRDAIQPSLGLLDAVIRTGDLAACIRAVHAKAELYQALAMRIEALAPPLGKDLWGHQLAERQRALARIDALAAPWRRAALGELGQVARLARTDPELVVGDPVLAEVVSESRAARATGVARR